MLGGLARWLRAAGYWAEFEYGIDDGELVDRARRTGAVLLSSDGPMFERRLLRDDVVQALFIPRGMTKLQQLAYVLRELDLPLRPARCMACGGPLGAIPRHQAATEAPPLAYRNCEQFWRCANCGKLLWRGTHWQRIERRLAEAAGPNPQPSPPDP